jgi:hypothetical protein
LGGAVALNAGKFFMEVELLGERLAQRAVIVNDQYPAASPHHFSRWTGQKHSHYARKLRSISPLLHTNP